MAINQVTVSELKDWLARDDAPVILDVREGWELGICSLPDAVHIPMGMIPTSLDKLERDRDMVIMCHHGIRSYQVAYFLQGQGFEHVHNLQGGINAWSKEIDPNVATY